MDGKKVSTNLPEGLEQISSPSKDVNDPTVASVPNDPSEPCEPTVEPESIEESLSTPMPAPAAEVVEQAVPEEQESSVIELTESEDNSQETDNKISCDSEPSRTDEPIIVTDSDSFASEIIQTESEVSIELLSQEKLSGETVIDVSLENSAKDTEEQQEDLDVSQLTDNITKITEEDDPDLTDNVKEVIKDDEDAEGNLTEATENIKGEEDEVNELTDNLSEIIDNVKEIPDDVKEETEEFKNEPEQMVDTETFDDKESVEIDTLESSIPSDISIGIISISDNDMVASPIVIEPEMNDIHEETSKECIEMEDLSPNKPDKDFSLDDSGKIQENGSDETLDNISSSVVFLTEDKSDDIHDESSKNVSEVLSETDEHSLDREISQENPVFVHVNSKSDKSALNLDSENDSAVGNDGDDGNDISIVEEDPIGVQENSDKSDMEFEENDTVEKEQLKDVFTTETIVSDKPVIVNIDASKDADEEICIIPDTERVISQEEKDAATAAAAATTEKDDDQDKDTCASNETESVDESTEYLDTMTTEASKPTETDDFSNVVEIPNDQAIEIPCHQCGLLKKCLHTIELANKKVYFCTSVCLEAYRELKKSQNKKLEGVITVKDISKTLMDKPPVQFPTVPTPNKVFIRRCAECTTAIILDDDKTLSWETMDFCNEDCLLKYQHRIGSHCANCKKVVIMSSLGKYCVRFGYDIRQFCCSLCLEEFKKGLKVCSYCQKDISGGTEGFLAPVGDKGQFKDFCSQLCMERYDHMSNSNPTKPLSLPADVSQCSVCKSEKLIVVLYEQNDKKHKFCSEPCFVAFKFVNHVDPSQCDMCKKYFETLEPTEFSIFYEQVVRNFCCKTCQNIYIIANRRIVPCSWCKVKKYNFDMIKKICNMNQILMMCSLNCLSLFKVSVNSVSTKSTVSYRIKCDFCAKMGQAQYHLAMSDSTVRNFCTYHCVMSFQNQYAKLPISLGDKSSIVSSGTPVPLGVPRRTFQNRQTRGIGNESNDVGLPIITNVQSLANQTNGPSSSNRANAVKINNQQNNLHPPPKVQIKQQIIVKKAPIPAMKNAAVLCKPILHTKGVNCRPQMFNKETQTDVIKEKTILVPVPVPIYVPSPLHMFSAPVPVPIPFPLPVPIPIFIPTTRNSSAGIIKEIKKIQVKIPTDPFEAELLMMAEMVAGEKKVDNTDSESDDDDNAASSAADGGFSPEAVDTSNTFGDDVLQMALKMATELDEPAVDLEGALTANTITATQTQDNTEEAVDDPQPMNIHHVIDRQALRGRKRTVRQPRNLNPSKRGRRMNSSVDMPMMPPPQPTQPPEPVEKPDANMCLKYTFGVNAWKQWVTTKNAELEKSSRRVKLFKPEILQLTSDELNYSLCLFVKEVRKPNGTEYAPDTIYYLCLGIQQYLFENGRIDNIFTDAYYEKFTDCLDEVARKFSILYNDSHYIVTRVEEEHLWESKQLGAHSPHVLLSTLMFFNTKHFNLTTVDEHMQLSFSHIMKHWKRNPNQPGATKVAGSRNVLLRFYPPQQALDTNSRKKKVYEQQENEENPLRCPVKLYEFYLSKCPESVKTRNDVFYLLPERSCVPDSPVWYSTMALGRDALEKMLHRVKMVKEINVALLTS